MFCCRKLVVAAAVLHATVSAHADSRQQTAPDLGRVSDRMRDFVRARQIAGAVTLVGHRGKVVHLSAIGHADLSSGRALTTDSIFRIASMTKPVTATALLMLQDQGCLSMDDPVEKHLPKFAGMALKDGTQARTVTIRDILTHTAGLRRPPREQALAMSLAEQVDWIAAAGLQYAPGSKWQYSTGLTVAGRIIEVVSGVPYDEFLRRHIFEPLGMNDTTFVLSPEQAGRLALTYQPADDGKSLKPTGHIVAGSDPTQPRTPSPSGGLFSTAGDLFRFYEMVRNGGALDGQRIVSQDAVRQMTRIHTGRLVTGFTPGNGWGLGWCVVREPQHVTAMLSPGTFGHGGAFGTQVWVDPKREMVFLLLIQRTDFGNSDGSDVREAFQHLAVEATEHDETPGAALVKYFGYDNCLELRTDHARAVLCPQAGGRVLEYSTGGKNALYLDQREQGWTYEPGKRAVMSAGRFDIGPEKVIPRRPKLWAGSWTGLITGPRSARLISMFDSATGVQLIRDFELAADSTRLSCTQTIRNVSKDVKEWCHWSRTFAQGNGICIIPLTEPGRYPNKYVMYEHGGLIDIQPQDPAIRVRGAYLEILDVPKYPKLGFDSYAGWFGYLSPNNLLFVKQFATYPDRVYNEVAGLTISVWYPEDRRVELEPIGPRERLEPGQTASFTENWWLAPYEFPAQRDAVDLAAFGVSVAKLIGQVQVSPRHRRPARGGQ